MDIYIIIFNNFQSYVKLEQNKTIKLNLPPSPSCRRSYSERRLLRRICSSPPPAPSRRRWEELTLPPPPRHPASWCCRAAVGWTCQILSSFWTSASPGHQPLPRQDDQCSLCSDQWGADITRVLTIKTRVLPDCARVWSRCCPRHSRGPHVAQPPLPGPCPSPGSYRSSPQCSVWEV